MKLFEQAAQRERRAFGAVRHHRHRLIVRAVDFPVQDDGTGIALIALLAVFAAVPRWSLDACLAARRNHLPIVARADAGRILACDER